MGMGPAKQQCDQITRACSTGTPGGELSGVAACSSVFCVSMLAGVAGYWQMQRKEGREQKKALMLPLGAREA